MKGTSNTFTNCFASLAQIPQKVQGLGVFPFVHDLPELGPVKSLHLWPFRAQPDQANHMIQSFFHTQYPAFKLACEAITEARCFPFALPLARQPYTSLPRRPPALTLNSLSWFQKTTPSELAQNRFRCARKSSSPLPDNSAPTTKWQVIAGHKEKSNKESRSSKPPSGECAEVSKQQTKPQPQSKVWRSAAQTVVVCNQLSQLVVLGLVSTLNGTRTCKAF